LVFWASKITNIENYSQAVINATANLATIFLIFVILIITFILQPHFRKNCLKIVHNFGDEIDIFDKKLKNSFFKYVDLKTIVTSLIVASLTFFASWLFGNR